MIIYTAEFVKDIKNLLQKFPPKHNNVFAHHTTIAFRPVNLDGVEISREKKLKIIGRAFDEKGDVILVEGSKSTNKHPHITISCADGIPPKYSSELIDKAIISNSIEYFSIPEEITVIEGYFDGKNDSIK